ncbi:DNA primase small subunit PriS [uncultured archaeon]|nr:DNA primase small subunit PriS [uncultured archaeon]
MGAEAFLSGALRGYYAANEITSVPEISMREFGIGEFGRKISSRHLSFRDNAALNHFLREKAPFYISYSNALYEFPGARPMEAKKMAGADLVYEFDADDIKTACKESHDSWKCTSQKCGREGKGRVLACDACGSGTKVEEWVCPECIAETRRQTLKLISFLRDDFGFSEGIAVNFSGSKGFHIHVRSESVRGLSKGARLELLDYLTATGLDLNSLGFRYDKDPKKRSFVCPRRSLAKGWAKRIFRTIESAFESGDASKLAVMGGTRQGAAEKLLAEKEKILGHMDFPQGGVLLATKGVDANKFWAAFLASAVDDAKLAKEGFEGNALGVDRQTSVDINKIVRVPGTLHGSTGLCAKEVPLEKIHSFEALDECVVLPESDVLVSNARAPRFYLGKKWFGPFSGEDVSLPLYAAFFLLARGNASLSDESVP